ncbi:MAG: hypothetical protein HY875_14445 [Chloroflexi bacterium]|nr:hypothetical protein [Chloroflexota bacterium]
MADNYWVKRLEGSRLSRRRFVGGAATAGAGAAGLALVGCGGDDDDDEGGETATTAPGGSPTVAATATKAGPQKGGVARFSSANNTWDTFDSDRSRFTPFAVLIGYTQHGIVQWGSFTEGKIGPGFAESWETPDKSTYVFKIKKGLLWHDKAPVNGRAATAKDAAAFILRNKAGKTLDGADDVNFYRKASFAMVDKAEAVDDSTLKVTLTAPSPFLFGLLAASYCKVQAPEAIAKFEKEYQKFSADQIIGTGNFTLNSFTAEGKLSFRRFEKSVYPVNPDGIDYVPLFTDEAALQAAFEQKQIDAYSPRQKAILDDLKKRYEGKIYEKPVFSANPMAGTYYGGAKPWSDPNLIGAIFRTIDRRAMIQQMFQGRAVLSAAPPPTQQAFTIAEKELITFPGYLEDRAKDLAEAKAMWAAGGGPALGEITIDIPDIWEGAYSGISAILTKQLKDNLGNDFKAKIEPYSTITTKILKLEYGNGKNNIWYGWISELQDIEPSQSMFRTYNSTQPQFAAYGVKSDKVDEYTNALNSEFDITKRQELSKNIARELIKINGAGIPYNLVNIENVLYWNYYKTGESVPFVTAPNFGRDVYFDQKDPTWTGRPA